MLPALGLFAALAWMAHSHEYFWWDLVAARKVQAIPGVEFETLMRWLSRLGTGWAPWVLTVGAGLLLMLARLRREALILMGGVGMGGLANVLIKEMVARPRPTPDLVRILVNYSGESFPSGHVLFFTQYLGFLLFLLLSRHPGTGGRLPLSLCLALLMALAGVSRIYEGAHWPSDVMGAYLAGAIWLLAMIRTLPRKKGSQAAAADP